MFALWTLVLCFYLVLKFPIPNLSIRSACALEIGLWLILIGFLAVTSFAEWVLLIVFLIPFEFSRALGPLPALSPNDYLCGAMLLVLPWKMSWRSFGTKIVRTFALNEIVCWSAFFVYSVVATRLLHGNLRHSLRWAAFLVFYLIAAQAKENDTRDLLSAKLARLLSFLGAGVALVGLCQFFRSHGNYENVTVAFEQHNPTGMFLSFCLPSAFFWWRSASAPKQPGRFFIMLLIVGGFLACYSRGAWIGIVSGVLLLWARDGIRLPRSATILVLAALSGGILFIIMRHPRLGLTGRQVHWAIAYRILEAHPIVGVGPGNYSTHFQWYLSPDEFFIYMRNQLYDRQHGLWLHLHNLYLQIFVEYGFLGGSFLLAGLAGLIRKAFSWPDASAWHKAFRISIIAFLVHSLFDILTINSFDYLFAFLLAILHMKNRIRSRSFFESLGAAADISAPSAQRPSIPCHRSRLGNVHEIIYRFDYSEIEHPHV